MNILFVCTGNTCRSPMAEAILKSKYDQDKVRSAGIFAGKGEPLAENSSVVLGEIDLTLNHHTSPVTVDGLEWADLVLTMTDRHKQTLAIQYPDYQDKFFTLKEYVLIDEDQWKQLKELYSHFEEKRTNLLARYKNLNDEEIEAKLREELEDDIRRIERMEGQLPDLNITDPFGGSLSVYRRTRDEISHHIEVLVNKLKDEQS
ncbi:MULTISPECIES: low molecular weight protein arginine phosphatase [Halobacillus]|uniref:low molecular weight protein arginine phosphatase n=1 Tax=Halobacillus TaxID=45667 RepID=UPI001367B5D1|nr:MULTISPECIES: low molecular weight protein arginine phosphatase [Halobacillus]MCA1020910.1 low molecular weight protein arginine phosphatase [Halobacillus litoralis]MYL29352.1 low molecular weight protein arginine phosphatase [Halobacillus halophilus]MYL36569.1 low molecular weight protein arginine phosphatase [Halobacillus litoralis]